MGGVALFEWLVSQNMTGEPDIEGLRVKALTPETASEVLRRAAGGAFASVAGRRFTRSRSIRPVLSETRITFRSSHRTKPSRAR